MFNNLGKLKYKNSKSIFRINISNLNEGINNLDNYIILKKNRKIIVYNRKCDHAGGKIITKDEKFYCPIHNWQFNPKTGKYNNGYKKEPIKYYLKENYLIINDLISKPNIGRKSSKHNKTNIRFFNHAFLKISGHNFSFCIDPWAIGPAFHTGWWLKNKTKDDWVEEVNKSDFIYISHNHPDHLHGLTLSKVSKEIPIVVPNFTTDSAGKFCEQLGFKNVIRFDFQDVINFKNSNLLFSILKSGDFREDSGIYFSNNNFSALIDVDSNMINFERLPKVDLYASSFAGGASGYPIMFENYNQIEKKRIILKKNNFLKKKKGDFIKKLKPKYFFPYASFFEEKLIRDKNVKLNNKKNSINDYKILCDRNKIFLMETNKFDNYFFYKNDLIKKSFVNRNYFNDIKENDYLEYFKKSYQSIDDNLLKEYFINSKFKDNLKLTLVLTDDEFRKTKKIYEINFSHKKIRFKIIKNFNLKLIKDTDKIKRLVIKVRSESLINTIINKLPWEDLMIGFQCKIFRQPNLYNYKFWHHFTNIYTTDKNVRVSMECYKCDVLENYFDSLIAKNI